MRTNKSIKEGKTEKIIELRNKGYSYGQINKETGISKSSISYHAGTGQKEKSLEKQRRQNGGFKRKIWGFIYSSRKLKKPFVYKTTTFRKKGREFFYGDKRRESGKNMKIKQPKIWLYWGKIFPGITSKSKHGEVQAVNQWTGKKDYYENGGPIMNPYVRCKLTDKIINAEGNDVHIDHADGDRTNNTIENFTIVKNWANTAKGECKGYDDMDEKLEIMSNTRRKYK
jgi:hypothetical protein|tara:strand:+ start:182 stop:862 length:681 start_codon:yes stop_codon:yes gene_type:complete